MEERSDEGGPTPDDRLDLSGVPCPQNSARALLSLEVLDPGQVLELIVDDGEPCQRVPVTLEWEGHEVLSMLRIDHRWRILVRRGDG